MLLSWITLFQVINFFKKYTALTIISGATRAQRGFREHHRVPSESDVSTSNSSETSGASFEVLPSSDAYTFPEVFQRLLRAFPVLQLLPILPKLSKSQFKTNRV